MTYSIQVSGSAPKGIGAEDEASIVRAAVERMARRLTDAGLTVSYATINGESLLPEAPAVPEPAPAPAVRVATPKRRR